MTGMFNMADQQACTAVADDVGEILIPVGGTGCYCHRPGKQTAQKRNWKSETIGESYNNSFTRRNSFSSKKLRKTPSGQIEFVIGKGMIATKIRDLFGMALQVDSHQLQCRIWRIQHLSPLISFARNVRQPGPHGAVLLHSM